MLGAAGVLLEAFPAVPSQQTYGNVFILGNTSQAIACGLADPNGLLAPSDGLRPSLMCVTPRDSFTYRQSSNAFVEENWSLTYIWEILTLSTLTECADREGSSLPKLQKHAL